MNTITVTGTGSIHVIPDVIRLEVCVESVFIDYTKAYERAKENASWVGKILEFNHLNASLAKSKHLDISDNYVDEYDDNDNYIGKSKNGFMLTQRIKIDLSMDTVLLNCIIRGIGKFIPDAQINVGYTIRDPRPVQLKILKRAVEDAKEKASIMAETSGCKLGEVSTIDYCSREMHVYSQARNIHSNAEAKASTPDALDITPDDLVMSDEVHVTWYLQTECK